MRRFEFKDDKAYKFWQIELAGTSFTVRWGRIGTKGQEQTKSFASDAAAQKEHDKLVAEKLKKGYLEVTKSKSAPPSPQEALENAIIANPDDLGAHAAYADWLLEQGDSRGEFIQVQLALEDEKQPPAERKKLQLREQELLRAHEKEWVGEWADLAEVGRPEGRAQLDFPGTRQYGFQRGILSDMMIGELTPQCAEAIVRSPQTRMVRRLRIGGFAYDEDYSEQPGQSILLRWPYFTSVRVFQLGWTSDEEYGDRCRFQCHLDGEGAHRFVNQMPNLEELYLFAHRVAGSEILAMNLPRLRVVQLYHSYDYALRTLANNASFANLTHLLCHPHSVELGERNAYIRLADLQAVVRSPELKSLTHLRLRLADFGDEGCEEIVKSGILKRLVELDLRHGRISDRGAKMLAACTDLKHLQHLDLSRNELTAEGIDALHAVVITVNTVHQYASTAGLDPNSYDAHEYLHEADYE